MAEHLKTPSEMVFKGNVSHNWKLWKQRFELYLLVSGKNNKDDRIIIAFLLNQMREEGLQIYNLCMVQVKIKKNWR